MVVQALLNWLRQLWSLWDHPEPEHRLNRWNTGQGLVEYALILVLVGVVVMAIMIVFGPAIANMYQNIYEQITR